MKEQIIEIMIEERLRVAQQLENWNDLASVICFRKIATAAADRILQAVRPEWIAPQDQFPEPDTLVWFMLDGELALGEAGYSGQIYYPMKGIWILSDQYDCWMPVVPPSPPQQ